VQHRLNHEVVELAHLAHTVGTALETGEPSPEQVSELREAADALEETVSRIERDFTDR
jgi:hypothetical protein